MTNPTTFSELRKKINNDITVDTDKKIQFRDTGLYIQSSSDGVLTISSDGTIAITATSGVTITGDLTVTGTFTFGDTTGDILIINGRVATG